VLRPGVYEVPFGLTVRQLIQMAGGVIGKEVQAVLLGGAAGVFIGPRRLDTPLTYEDAKAQNFPLGSGVIMVFDEAVDLREIMYMLARFFAHESCGKCYPCAARHATATGDHRAHPALWRPAGRRRDRPARHRPDHDPDVALRPGPDGGLGRPQRHRPLAGAVRQPGGGR
jgi:NADH-quinone oxidoreductase subunit F